MRYQTDSRVEVSHTVIIDPGDALKALRNAGLVPDGCPDLGQLNIVWDEEGLMIKWRTVEHVSTETGG